MTEMINAPEQYGFDDTSLDKRGKTSRTKNLHLEVVSFLQARGNVDRPDQVAAQAA
jgi:hypothetical protein